MNAVGWLFVYTPFPWLAAMYVVAYRHDLARITRPIRDLVDQKEWWSVCRHLGLIDGSAKMPTETLGYRVWLAIFSLAIISALWTMIPYQLTWYELIGLQVAAAFPFFLLLASNFGPFPYQPYRDFLPYPRIGTRLRHLDATIRELGGKPDASAVQEGGGGKR